MSFWTYHRKREGEYAYSLGDGFLERIEKSNKDSELNKLRRTEQDKFNGFHSHREHDIQKPPITQENDKGGFTKQGEVDQANPNKILIRKARPGSAAVKLSSKDDQRPTATVRFQDQMPPAAGKQENKKEHKEVSQTEDLVLKTKM